MQPQRLPVLRLPQPPPKKPGGARHVKLKTYRVTVRCNKGILNIYKVTINHISIKPPRNVVLYHHDNIPISRTVMVWYCSCPITKSSVGPNKYVIGTDKPLIGTPNPSPESETSTPPNPTPPQFRRRAWAIEVKAASKSQGRMRS